MRELVFALEFRGRAGAMPGARTLRQARTSAPSQMLRTVIGPVGIESRIELVAGEQAVLESTVERFPDGGFTEDGVITYGTAGRVTFATVGKGTVGPGPIPGCSHGAVVWTVTGGEGRFLDARGLITSNFTVSGDGDVADHHFARLYLPD